MDTEALSAEESAAFCGISRSKWFELAAAGETPPSFKIGGKRKWLRNSILRWMQDKERDTEERNFGRRQRAFIGEFCSRHGVRRKWVRRALAELLLDDERGDAEYFYSTIPRLVQKAPKVGGGLVVTVIKPDDMTLDEMENILKEASDNPGTDRSYLLDGLRIMRRGRSKPKDNN